MSDESIDYDDGSNKSQDEDPNDNGSERSEHQIAADLQSRGAYAPSLRSIKRRESI